MPLERGRGTQASHISITSTAFPVSQWTAASRVGAKPDSDHTETISNTIRVRQASWNVMNPRIQCALRQWNPDFTASTSGPNAVKSRFHDIREQARCGRAQRAGGRARCAA